MQLRMWFVVGVVAVLPALGCQDEGPPAVASVLVTSPIGTRLGVGRTVQLAAQPRDNQGNPLSVPVTWGSSAPPVANVGTGGDVSGAAAGTATITAAAGGVSGTLTLQVIAADFTSIIAALSDAYFNVLPPFLSNSARQATLNALAQCTSGVTQGAFNSIEACVADARAVAGAATDPTDRALLPQIVLFLDHVERRLQP